MLLQPNLPTLCIGLFFLLLCWAALGDLRRYVIPNRLNLAIAALYLPYALSVPGGAYPLSSLGVAAAVLVAGMFAFARGWFGGGDVKMLAAVSLWAGTAHLPLLILVTAAAGGVVALAVLCRPLVQRLAHGPAAVEASRDVPYGIAIAVGGIAVASQLLVN